jgi:protein-S-isoprenylcysteine O-methyltransferase Ste14
MGRLAILVYGVVCYLAFLGAFLYAIGFTENLLVPKGIDDGAAGPLSTALLINVGLLSLFAIQHTIMARPAFKRWFTTIIPKPAERSTFVLLASLLLMLLFWQWRPMTDVVWEITTPALRTLLLGISLAGWAMVFYVTFLIDHFDLFGLRQTYLYYRGQECPHPQFVVRSLYRWIRHPLMLGFLIAFWSTPAMTQGHLLFCVVTTGYIFFGIWVEERDLLEILGDDYAKYRARTSMILPLGIFTGSQGE